MTLDEIRWMSELCETRKMSKAAENLFISQPALSQCLQRVEKELGFKLFSRSNKGMVPTEKAFLFYETAQTISNSYQNFLTKAALMDQKELREISIAMPPYLSSNASTDLLIQLKAACPDIQFSVLECSAAKMEENLRNNEAQIMITSEPFVPVGMASYPLAKALTAIFLRADSGLRAFAEKRNGRNYLEPSLLREEPITITKKGQSSRLLAEMLFAECGISPNIRHETSHISTLFKNAKVGISSSIGLCTQLVMDMDKDGTIVHFVSEKYKLSKVRVMAYTLKEVDNLIPKELYQILRKAITESGVYYSGE